MVSSTKIDDELKDRVQHLADLRQRSSHGEAIASYMSREEARESFKQEALDSWTAYQETGQHLTSNEVRAWLKTWGNEPETKLPPCHR